MKSVEKYNFGDIVYMSSSGFYDYKFVKSVGNIATLFNPRTEQVLDFYLSDVLKEPVSKTKELLSEMIELNKNSIELRRKSGYSVCIAEDIFKRECCTVRFNLGRQSGHTSAIKSLASANDLVIFLNPRLALDSGLSWTCYRSFPGDRTFIDFCCDRIFVDCASSLTKDAIDSIYEMKFNQLILVG